MINTEKDINNIEGFVQDHITNITAILNRRNLIKKTIDSVNNGNKMVVYDNTGFPLSLDDYLGLGFEVRSRIVNTLSRTLSEYDKELKNLVDAIEKNKGRN